MFAPKSKSSGKKRTSYDVDDDDDFNGDVEVGAKRETGRAKKAPKYNFSDSEDSDM